MKEKLKITLGALVLVAILAFLGFYFSMAGYYADRFAYGTWINGIYCTGSTVEEINRQLVSANTSEEFMVFDKDGTVEVLELQSIGYEISYLEDLHQIKAGQNPLLWGIGYFRDNNYEVSPVYSFSEEQLQSKLEQMAFMTDPIYDESNRAMIVKNASGYTLIDPTKMLLKPEEAVMVVSDALRTGQRYVNLATEGCYEDLPITEEAEEVYELWDKIEDFQDFHVAYFFGDEVYNIDASVTCDWIQRDENGEFIFDNLGNLVLNTEAVALTVAEMAEIYSTLDGTHLFYTTGGEWIEVEGGTYGNEIDQEAEVAFLTELFLESSGYHTRTPEYLTEAATSGRADLGSTYVEVDMSGQMLYYYQDNELLLETPVVTGNMARGWDTPSVVCYVYAKQRNRILRGDNYATFVYYWMPVYGNIGFHDATWRNEFGGDIYETDGSHGCINMPKDAAAQLYEYVEIGTPVVLYY